MIGIIGLTLISVVLSVFSIIDIYKNRNDILRLHPLSICWIGFTVGALIVWLLLDASHYLDK